MFKRLFVTTLTIITSFSSPVLAESTIDPTCSKPYVTHEYTGDLKFCFRYTTMQDMEAYENTDTYFASIRYTNNMMMYYIKEKSTGRVASFVIHNDKQIEEYVNRNVDWEMINKYEPQRQQMMKRFVKALANP